MLAFNMTILIIWTLTKPFSAYLRDAIFAIMRLRFYYVGIFIESFDLILLLSYSHSPLFTIFHHHILHHYVVVYATTTINTLLQTFKYYKTIVVIGDICMPIEEKKQLVTSLRIDPEIWKEAKIQAIKHDITLTELLEEAINCWIRQQTKERK
jgi:hypothetical protein